MAPRAGLHIISMDNPTTLFRNGVRSMIDNEKEVHELMEALQEHLPMQAYVTSPVVASLRRQNADIKVDDAVTIDSVLYMGDEGGVACSIGLAGGTSIVVASITHLRVDSNHPLARRIQAYQLRRSQRLAGPASAVPERGVVATKTKRSRARTAAKVAGQSSTLRIRLQTGQRLWACGEYKQAANSFREALKLQRHDPSFSRYWLASCLFQLGLSDELDKLLATA